jgi:hypothetical protein
VVGLPESSKRHLELRVRSGVRVEGCRDRLVRQVRRTLSVSKKSGRLPGKAVNTKREHQRDRIKLSLLHGSGNVNTTIIR